MIKFIKRYVCDGDFKDDFENKVVFYQVLVKKQKGGFAWNDIIVKGFLVFLKGGRYDRHIKGMYELSEEKWQELENLLYDTVEKIDCKEESEFESYEKGLVGITLPELHQFLEKNGRKVK